MTRKSICALLAAAGLTVVYSAEPPSKDSQSEKAKPQAAKEKVYPTMGSVERIEPSFDFLVAPGAVIEKLASGFRWSEGPVWDRHGHCLLLSDVPNNVVFKWQPGAGTRVFLEPSGYTGSRPELKEGGSNGLAFDRHGNLLLCQHGDRRVARWTPRGGFKTVAEYYNFRRLNSPNDLVVNSKGDIYFTDPPYGLKGNDDPAKELSINGVYRVTPKGEVKLLVSDLTFPNGLAFSPDEKILYVAISDQKAPRIMAYDVEPDGALSNARMFFDAAPLAAKAKGLPDGLKVDRSGNVWATGPGGVLVLAPDGRHLGTINTGDLTANCAFGGEDGSVLYMTANSTLCRIKTLTKGAGF